MTRRVVILGGGTGGTLAANRLRRRFRTDELAITVVDQDDRHVYQPGLLFVPFGITHVEDIVRPRQRQLRRGIDFVQQAIDHVDIDATTVQLDDGTTLSYDVLVVATGARWFPEETEGSDRAGVDGERSSPSTTPRARRHWRRRWRPSTGAESSSTSSTCRSSARSRRSSSASWPTGTSTSAGSAIGCSSPT